MFQNYAAPLVCPAKKIEMRKASLSKSIGINSLRWHYPNQVMGRSEIRFLSADSIVSSPLCAIENIIATLVELDKNFLQKNLYLKSRCQFVMHMVPHVIIQCLVKPDFLRADGLIYQHHQSGDDLKPTGFCDS